jgi:NAD(P)-dependent dehydrogenase (short-subunit alcohol dehydrogenase family)
MTGIHDAYRLDPAPHALITGGGTGIGRAVAARLSEMGARVTVVGRRPGPLEEIANDLSAAQAVAFDVIDEMAVKDGISAATGRFGPVDILINSAGAAESAPVGRTTLDAWRAVLEVNLTGVFLVTRAVLPGMMERGGGRIVNVASTAGLKGYAYVAPYCAAKHGVVGLTRSLALEVAKKGITANAVCPGFTETDLLEQSVANIAQKTGAGEEGARKQLVEVNPQGRFVQPEEVAETVAWLVGPNSGALNGQAIAVAGGEVT